jgi:hypothetical protein
MDPIDLLFAQLQPLLLMLDEVNLKMGIPSRLHF